MTKQLQVIKSTEKLRTIHEPLVASLRSNSPPLKGEQAVLADESAQSSSKYFRSMHV